MRFVSMRGLLESEILTSQVQTNNLYLGLSKKNADILCSQNRLIQKNRSPGDL
jgi:hypothetical protein